MTHLLEPQSRTACGRYADGLPTTDMLPRVTCGQCLRVVARRGRPHPPHRPGMFSARRWCPLCRAARAVSGGKFVDHWTPAGEPCAGSGQVAPDLGAGWVKA